MNALKLTTYFGERERVGQRFLADALLDLYARHRIEVSLLLRGAQGFGAKHHLRTDRLLTLSEDLPVVSLAVDAEARIEALLPEVEALQRTGLVTVERARLLDGVPELQEPAKLTLYLAGGRPAFVAACAALHRHGAAGASVLPGVDATVHGERERAGLLRGNARVPAMVLAVGPGAALTAAAAELRPRLATLERIRILRRDGRALATPHTPANEGWVKLMVHSAAEHGHDELVRRLRAGGVRGATTLRGVWGFHGDHDPSGDRLLQVGRRAPVVTVVLDAPDRIGRALEIIEELTAERGLVTSELVPRIGPGARG